MRSDKEELFSPYGRDDIAASVVAILTAVLFHLALFFLIPYEVKPLPPKGDDFDDFKVEISPPELESIRNIPEFVEANPLANQSEPEPNAPESFQNQRAADELPDVESKSRKPFVGGELKDGNKIVSGDNSQEASPGDLEEILKRPLAPPSGGESEQREKPSEVYGPKAGVASESSGKVDPESSGVDSVGSGKENQESLDKEDSESLDKPESGENVILIPDSNGRKSSSGSKKLPRATESEKPESGNPKTERRADPGMREKSEPLPDPKPRPQLSMRTPQGPLMDNNQRTSEQGTVAVDSRFSEFGAYQQRMIEAISRQWNLLASQFNLTGTVNTHVVIEYKLNPKGELTKLEVLFSNSSHTGRGLCEQSILSTAPYGEWSRDMLATLGAQDQSVRITFYYR